jgi:hypothetical protein
VVGSAGSGPRTTGYDFFICQACALFGQYYFFHHLSDNAVCQNNGGIAVFESQIKSYTYEICHFLY